MEGLGVLFVFILFAIIIAVVAYLFSLPVGSGKP